MRTVITPRPGTHARFSTNRFHDTWHVLSDDRGARMLARLLWGLSFQARPGTVVLLDREFLTPTPFDADPADPIVLAPGWCTRFDENSATQLKRIVRSHDSSTVRWHTFGLEQALTAEESDYRRVRGEISRRRGILVLSPATPDDARRWALDAARLDSSYNGYGTDYTYLDEWNYGHDGEIQVFRRFHQMTSVARQARAQVLGRADAPADPDAVRMAVWDEAEKVRGEAHLRVRELRGGAFALGEAAAAMLARAEVYSLDDLAELGAVETYRRLRAAEAPGLTPEMLWALEGALTSRDRRSIDQERRRALLAELGPGPEPKSRPRRRYRAPIRPIRR